VGLHELGFGWGWLGSAARYGNPSRNPAEYDVSGPWPTRLAPG